MAVTNIRGHRIQSGMLSSVAACCLGSSEARYSSSKATVSSSVKKGVDDLDLTGLLQAGLGLE